MRLISSASEIACKYNSPLGCQHNIEQMGIYTGCNRTRSSPLQVDCAQVYMKCKHGCGKVYNINWS